MVTHCIPKSEREYNFNHNTTPLVHDNAFDKPYIYMDCGNKQIIVFHELVPQLWSLSLFRETMEDANIFHVV